MKHKSTILFLLLAFSIAAYAQKSTTLLYGPNDNGKTYTSLEEALSEPENVYRLRLRRLPARDSLPGELFQLTELRELTIKGCNLWTVNSQIKRLNKLQYLNLDNNKLVRLPESLSELSELRTLIISRNMIETLPESIGKMKKLVQIDAWNNPLYILPESIKSLQNTLQTLDLRQIPLTRDEYIIMTEQLPNTNILFTNICECENHRDHN